MLLLLYEIFVSDFSFLLIILFKLFSYSSKYEELILISFPLLSNNKKLFESKSNFKVLKSSSFKYSTIFCFSYLNFIIIEFQKL